MDRKDFIKKTVLGMVATAFVQWDVQALGLATKENEGLYCRSVFRYKPKKLEELKFYKYNSILLNLDLSNNKIIADHEIIIADQLKDFPKGSYGIFRTSYTFSREAEGSSIFVRKGPRKEPQWLTTRKHPKAYIDVIDELYLHPDKINIETLAKEKKIKIENQSKNDTLSLAAIFALDTRAIIRSSKDFSIPTLSHQKAIEISSQEALHQSTIQDYFTQNNIPSDDQFATAQPKKKSFLEKHKDREQKERANKLKNRKYHLIDCKETVGFKDSPIKYFVSIQMEGELLRGNTFTMSLKNKPHLNITSKEYQFSFELLEDFEMERKTAIRFAGKQADYNNMSDEIHMHPQGIFQLDQIYVKELTRYSGSAWVDFKEATLYTNREKIIAIGDPKEAQGCYLTTACVQHRALADNCYELTTLRHFRDTYMLATTEGQQLIKRYYHMAPQIVKTINAQPQSAEKWEFIYQQLVVPSVSFIEQGKQALAMEYYKAFTLTLEQKVLPYNFFSSTL